MFRQQGNHSCDGQSQAAGVWLLKLTPKNWSQNVSALGLHWHFLQTSEKLKFNTANKIGQQTELLAVIYFTVAMSSNYIIFIIPTGRREWIFSILPLQRH